MPSAANGNVHAIFAGEVHRSDHVRHVATLHDDGWVFIDHGVIDLARRIIIRITRLNQCATQANLQLLYRLTCYHAYLL